MSEDAENYTIIDLGGSILVPNGGPNKEFIQKFQPFILGFLQAGKRIVIVSGGGAIARHYQEAVEAETALPDEEKDWIGIHATRLNAQYLRAVFYEYAHPYVIDGDPHEKRISQKLADLDQYKLFIASGWKPGNSTDYVSVVLAKYFGSKEVIVATRIPYVYDEDVEKNGEAHAIKKISWADYRKMIQDMWTPGMKSPVDPIAAKLAEDEGITARVLRADNFDNFSQAMRGEEFEGSVIS